MYYKSNYNKDNETLDRVTLDVVENFEDIDKIRDTFNGEITYLDAAFLWGAASDSVEATWLVLNNIELMVKRVIEEYKLEQYYYLLQAHKL